jgi:hypothetical protein
MACHAPLITIGDRGLLFAAVRALSDAVRDQVAPRCQQGVAWCALPRSSSGHGRSYGDGSDSVTLSTQVCIGTRSG